MKATDLSDRRALTVAEAARYVCVSRSTMENWLAKGLIPYEELPGSGTATHRFRRVRKMDIDEFLDRCYSQAQEVGRREERKRLVLLRPRGS